MAEKNTDSRRQLEVIGVLLMTLALLLTISFVTYSAQDELSVNRYFIIENAMGIIGVFASYTLIKFGFGYISWGFILMIGLWGWWIFAGKERQNLLRFSIYLFIMMYVLATMLSVPALKTRLFLPSGYVVGGLIGGATAELFQDWFGVLPTLILLSVIMMILIFAYLRLSMFAPLLKIRDSFSNLLYRIGYHWRRFLETRRERSQARKEAKALKRIKKETSDNSVAGKKESGAQGAVKEEGILSFGDEEDPIPFEEDIEMQTVEDEAPEIVRPVAEGDAVPFGRASGLATAAHEQEGIESATGDEPVPGVKGAQQNHANEILSITEQSGTAAATGSPFTRQAEHSGEESGDEDDLGEYEVEEKLTDELINYDENRETDDRPEYKLPSVDLLNDPEGSQEVDPDELNENAKILTQTLADFGVSGKVTKVIPGPVVTLYEVEPATGVRVNRISVLSDDIARVMSAKRIRIIAPIPGKNVVGVEIPNKSPEIVYFKSIVNSEMFSRGSSVLSIALGKTVNGQPFTFNLDKMPHLLIAGTTGSGKSVCINTLIMSILYRAKPSEVKFIMVDPKKLELSVYKALVNYHLITSEDIDEYVITSPQNAVMALRSAEVEMERRYTVLSEAKVRNIAEYNNRAEQNPAIKALPYIVVIIDELADLMITASREIEEPIARLAQMARAVGIHLVVATQRPSVDVITGVIRSNFPARIAFQVPTKIDSRTILDTGGAEKLLGKGDMLFLSPGTSEPVRVHNSFVVLEEIEAVLEHITKQSTVEEEFLLPSAAEDGGEGDDMDLSEDGERDKLFEQAMRLVVQHQQGSISLVQRRLRVGYSRAARLIDELEQAGIVGPFTGSKAREVLVEPSYLEHVDSIDDGSFDDD